MRCHSEIILKLDCVTSTYLRFIDLCDFDCGIVMGNDTSQSSHKVGWRVSESGHQI